MSQLTFSAFEQEPELEPASSIEVASWYKGRVLSHSSISTYRACPQRWKFRYIDKIPEKPKSFFSFGKSVHSGLEFLFQKRETLVSIDQLIDHYKNQWRRDGYESPAQEKWFYQEGERILRGFYAKNKTTADRVLEVELKFTISIEGVPVTGYIDRVDKTPKGGLSIIDYKTGKAFDKSRVKSDPQLTMYQIACSQLFDKPVESVTLYHLNSLTPLSVPAHSHSQESSVKSMVLEAAKGISGQIYDAKPDEKGVCKYCDYTQICPAYSKQSKSSSPSASNFMGSTTDRLGKLDSRIEELTRERADIASELKAYMESKNLTKVDGEHYSAQVQDNGQIKSLPVENGEFNQSEKKS